MKVFPGSPYTWPPPRGPRNSEGSWGWTLDERANDQFVSSNPLLRGAVHSYAEVISRMQNARLGKNLTVRALATTAGLSLSVTTAALTGTAWPRWPTLESMSEAVGCQLQTEAHRPDIINQLLMDVEHIQHEDNLSKRMAASELGMRPNTLYDLAKDGRAPSSATVFALSVWCQRPIVLARLRS